MVRLHRDKTPLFEKDINFDDIHILTLQGHPEIEEPLMTDLILELTVEGVIDKETADDALEIIFLPTDGTGIIGRGLWKVLGVKVPTT